MVVGEAVTSSVDLAWITSVDSSVVVGTGSDSSVDGSAVIGSISVVGISVVENRSSSVGRGIDWIVGDGIAVG